VVPARKGSAQEIRNLNSLMLEWGRNFLNYGLTPFHGSWGENYSTEANHESTTDRCRT
jgi:hypothetical protein